jgi:hypothetical protein
MFFGRRDEELPGVLRVADRGLGVKAEHGGQVQGVRPAGEGFLELPVDAEPFQRRVADRGNRSAAVDFGRPPP